MTIRKKTLPQTVRLEGKGQLTLRSSDHLGTGGEGSVYRAGDIVVKLYAEPEKKKREGMEEKLGLLRQLSHPAILAPLGRVYDSTTMSLLGYYMPQATGEPLPRVFTNDFRSRTGFTDTDATTLVARMRDAVDAVHSYGALLIDPNESNWYARYSRDRGPSPFLFDTDSFSIGRFGASVLMPSIRDYHTSGFSQNTDWFSWGVVTFQVYTGIHPYKGMLDGYRPGALEERMRANASVFHRGVRLNRAVRDFSVIPGSLRAWYEAVFENGERSMPPSPLDCARQPSPAPVLRMVSVGGSDALVFEKRLDLGADRIIRIFPEGMLLTEAGHLYDLVSGVRIYTGVRAPLEGMRTERGWLMLEAGPDRLRATHVHACDRSLSELSFSLHASTCFSGDGRLFAVTATGLTELMCRFPGKKPVLTAGATWSVLAKSTTWFPGVGIEDAMGAFFLIVPFGGNGLAHTRVPELDGMKPVAAQGGNRLVAVVALAPNGEYRRYIFWFDALHGSYTSSVEVVDGPELNVTMLPKGVGATIQEDGEMRVFVPSSGAGKKIQDSKCTTDLHLAHVGDMVVYADGGALWQVRMR